MNRVTPNSKPGLPTLMPVVVPADRAKDLVKDDTRQAHAGTAHCPGAKRTEPLPCPSIRKWLSGMSQVTMLGALVFSGCTSEQSGEQGKQAQQQKENTAGKPVRKEVGEASWYGPGFQGQETANGETFN